MILKVLVTTWIKHLQGSIRLFQAVLYLLSSS